MQKFCWIIKLAKKEEEKKKQHQTTLIEGALLPVVVPYVQESPQQWSASYILHELSHGGAAVTFLAKSTATRSRTAACRLKCSSFLQQNLDRTGPEKDLLRKTWSFVFPLNGDAWSRVKKLYVCMGMMGWHFWWHTFDKTFHRVRGQKINHFAFRWEESK